MRNNSEKTKPTVTLYEKNTPVGTEWYVNIYFAPTTTRPKFRHRSPLKFSGDRAAAERLLAAWLDKNLPAIIKRYEGGAGDNPADTSPAGPRLQQIFDYYTETYLPVKGANERTVTEARRIMREFELFCRSRHIGRASQLNRLTVDEHQRELIRTKSPKTVHTSLALIRAAMNAALDAGLLDKSPVTKWLMPELTDPEIHPYSAEQLRAILEAVRIHEPAVWPIVRWHAATGNRPSDVRDLRVRQIDFEARTVKRAQVKTKKLATYRIGDEAIRAARDALAGRKPTPDTYVFIGPDGGPFQRNYVLRALQRAATKAGLEYTPDLKRMRHTYAFIMANEVGMPLNQLQAQMGHSDIRMTLKYVQPGDATPYIASFDAIIAGADAPLKTVTPASPADEGQ